MPCLFLDPIVQRLQKYTSRDWYRVLNFSAYGESMMCNQYFHSLPFNESQSKNFLRLFFTNPFRRVPRVVIVGLLGIPFGWTSATAAPSLAPSDSHKAREVVVTIKTRQFDPPTVYFQSGEKTRLILRNQDVELHAFVPVSLLQNTTLHVSGSGAPQFGPQGLLRILLPSRGETEILFVPDRPGNYPFFCDLPGHIMRGMIVVQE